MASFCGMEAVWGVQIPNVVPSAGKIFFGQESRSGPHARFGKCLPKVSRKFGEINGTAGRTFHESIRGLRKTAFGPTKRKANVD